MLGEIRDVAVVVVTAGALLRGAAVILLSVRTFLQRDRFASLRIDRGFVLAAPEPFLMFGIAARMAVDGVPPSSSVAATIASVAGAALVLGGWLVVLWTLASWPSIFVGHALLRDHRLVNSGAYGRIRHPVYLAALSIWLGFGVGLASWWIVALTLGYVLPAYLVYMRDEEVMLEEAFGDEYRRYRAAVPMLIPRWVRR